MYTYYVHWSDLNPNPDSPQVINQRSETVSAGFRKPIDTYKDLIELYLSSRKVLDFGAANHNVDTKNISGESTHSQVVRAGNEILGLDIVEFSSKCATPKCTHLVGNYLGAKGFDLGEFDVVFCGHVIEHLASPGELFQFAKKTLSSDGLLVIVTPNPLWIVGLFYRSLGQNVSVNADHVALFGASELIELAERNGFALSEWCYSGRGDMESSFRPGGRFMSRAVNILYRACRILNLPFSHNQLVATFTQV